MKIWIGESKNLIKDCIDHLIKNYGASDYYNIKSKAGNSTYLEQVNYLYLLNNNTIGSGRDRDKFEAIKAKELHLHDILHTSKLLPMSIENTKIWIGGDVEKSKKVQEILFKLGCGWMGGSTEVFERNMNYIRVDYNKNAIYSLKCSREFFLKLDEIEISYEDLCQIRSKTEEESMTTMGIYGRGLMPKHLMCGCDVGEREDISVNDLIESNKVRIKSFFKELKKNQPSNKENNFISPIHIKREQDNTKQIPSWGGKLYVIPPKGKMRPRIKAKRAWEIL